MKVKQFNSEGCLSYLVYCSESKEAVIVDPTNPLSGYEKMIKENSLQVKYVIETHTHADHVSMAREVARAYNSKIVMHENIKERDKVQIPNNIPQSIINIVKYNSEITPDLLVTDKDTLVLGKEEIKFITTPGHTVDGMCVQISHLLFTGDTLLIGQCGRTDLPGGNGEELYHSLFKELNQLPDDLVIYPAHDYQGGINTALGYERVNNNFLKERDLKSFNNFISQFFPPLEDANGGKLQCSFAPKAPTADEGQKVSSIMNQLCFHMEQYLRTAPKDWNGITSPELKTLLDKGEDITLIDVREPFELEEIGYIKGIINIPLHKLADNMHHLPPNKNKFIVVLCHSGSRSAYGSLFIRGYGYTNVRNLEQGMIGWLKNKFPVVKGK